MIEIKQKVDLTDLSTMMTKGTAECVIEWESADDLRLFLSEDRYERFRLLPMIPIGQGSNILFVSDEFSGTLLKCTSKRIELLKNDDVNVTLKVAAGVLLDDLIAYCCDNEFWGLENLSLIPGTVGGAAVQNVGAYGVEFKDVVKRVDCFDLVTNEEKRFETNDLCYGYRDSIFKRKDVKGRYVVTSVEIELSKRPDPQLSYGNLTESVGDKVNNILAIRNAVISMRRSKLPEVGIVGSAGSFFKNPVVTEVDYFDIIDKIQERGIDTDSMPTYDVIGGRKKLSAAWLIDKAGWKGVIKDHAGVWAKQPLVLVNADGQAKGSDIASLAGAISADINEKFGVMLHPEVEYIL